MRVTSRFASVGLEQREEPHKGRGLYCVRNFSEGEELLAGEAFLRVGHAASWGDRCAACFVLKEESEESFRMCAGCGMVAFCSPACAESEQFHRQECRALPDLVHACSRQPGCNRLSSEEAILACNLLLVARALRILHSAAPAGWLSGASTVERARADLGGLAVSPDENEVTLEQRGFAAVLLDVDKLQLLLPLSVRRACGGLPGLEQAVVHCYRQLSCNSFLMCDHRFAPVAQVCDPLTALLNHSCEPNAAIVWHCPAAPGSRTHTVRCLRPLVKGEEVLICYLDPGRPWWVRQPSLKASYGFVCNCSLCSEISAYERSKARALPRGITASLESVTSADGKVLMLSSQVTERLCTFLCREMGLAAMPARDSDIQEVSAAASALDHLAGEEESLHRLSPSLARQRLSKLHSPVRILLQRLGPKHMLLRELVRVLYVAEAAGDWTECLAIAPKVLDALGASPVSVKYADVLALQAIGRLKTFLTERSSCENAKETASLAAANEALTVLRLLHGPFLEDHPRGKALQGLLRELEGAASGLDSMD